MKLPFKWTPVYTTHPHESFYYYIPTIIMATLGYFGGKRWLDSLTP